MFKKLLFLSLLISIVEIQGMIKSVEHENDVLSFDALKVSFENLKYQFTHITEKNCPNLWYTFNKRKNEGKYDPTEYVNKFNNAVDQKNKNTLCDAILKMNIFIYRSARMGNNLKCLRMLLEIRNKVEQIDIDISIEEMKAFDKKARLDAKFLGSLR